MENRTATTRHIVTRKEEEKSERDIEKLIRKNQMKKDVY